VRPVPNLTLTAGVSLLHSEIKDKRVYAQVCALNGVVVCTVNDPTIKVGTNTFAQIDGKPLPNAPKYNLNFAARYDIPVNDSGKFFVATDWNLQGYTSFVLYDQGVHVEGQLRRRSEARLRATTGMGSGVVRAQHHQREEPQGRDRELHGGGVQRAPHRGCFAEVRHAINGAARRR
jgi:hypothetical protein